MDLQCLDHACLYKLHTLKCTMKEKPASAGVGGKTLLGQAFAGRPTIRLAMVVILVIRVDQGDIRVLVAMIMESVTTKASLAVLVLPTAMLSGLMAPQGIGRRVFKE